MFVNLPPGIVKHARGHPSHFPNNPEFVLEKDGKAHIARECRLMSTTLNCAISVGGKLTWVTLNVQSGWE